VYVKNLTTGTEDTLNAEAPAGWFHHPTVSADSSLLFYGSFDNILAIDLGTRALVPTLELNSVGYLLGLTRNGYLLYLGNQSVRPTVWARKFDQEGQRYEGQGFVLLHAEGDRVAVSRQGHLIYEPRVDPDKPWYNEPIYVYRRDQPVEFVAHAGTYTDKDHDEFRISPDGNFLAIKVMKGGIVRFERSSRTTIELVSTEMRAYPGQYSYDGRWLYFYAHPSETWQVYRVPSNGLSQPELIADRALLPSIAEDGETLVFVRIDGETGFDIWKKDLSTGEESPVVVAERRQWYPWVSPDGRFVGFESVDARNMSSILVHDFVSGRTTALADGVVKPRWNWDGTYLYFESEEIGEIYRVPVRYDVGTGISFGTRETVYSDPRSDHTHWSVPDAEDTILVSAPEGGIKGGSRWRVILNWEQTLEDQ
jgi:hypothetical protein